MYVKFVFLIILRGMKQIVDIEMIRCYSFITDKEEKV